MRIQWLNFRIAAASAMIALGAGLPAHGAVTTSVVKDVAPAGGTTHDPYSPVLFNASSSDLAEGLIAGYDGDSTFESSAGVTAWTDGALATVYPQGGSGGDDIDHAAYGSVTNDTTATFDLGGLHDLDQVDVYAGWNDSGRDLFSFDLLVSANGSDYSLLTSFLKGQDDTGAITTPVTSQISITNDSGALASAVRYVRLSIYDADNNAAGLAEVDVFGSAVPEPAAALLLALSGAALSRGRRQHAIPRA